MRGTVAKRLRREARLNGGGRKTYRHLKRLHKQQKGER